MGRDTNATIRRELVQGWPVVLAAALAISVGTMGMGFYSLGLFLQPLQQEYHWSRGAVSGAATFQQLGIFLSAPIVGLLADRYGARLLTVISYGATAAALVLLSRVGPSLVAWYGLWLLVSLAGCGTTPAIWARVVSQRFNRARGLALGLMLLGTGTAAMLAPALLGPLFISHGWRFGVLVMAATTLIVGLPVSLMMKSGGVPAKTKKARGRFERNRATITLSIVACLLGFLVAALIIHLVPMLVDRGMDKGAAARAAAMVGLAVLGARIVVGYLFDHYHAPHVAGFFLLAPVASCLLLLFDGPVVLAALGLGIAAGAEVDMLAYLTSRYAPMERYSATYGVILGLFCLGASFGPMAFGWSVDRTGNYDFALGCAAIALALVAFATCRLGPYAVRD